MVYRQRPYTPQSQASYRIKNSGHKNTSRSGTALLQSDSAPQRPNDAELERDRMEKSDKIYIAGHRGLVGTAVTRALQKQGYTNLVERTDAELELTDQCAVAEFFPAVKPDVVVLAAAQVGGILANNTYPADFIYSNICIPTNVIATPKAVEN